MVHGAEHFRKSVMIDEEVRDRIEDAIELAPLHNPHNLRGIQSVRAALGEGIPQVAVFDTAFHLTLPASDGIDLVDLLHAELAEVDGVSVQGWRAAGCCGT